MKIERQLVIGSTPSEAASHKTATFDSSVKTDESSLGKIPRRSLLIGGGTILLLTAASVLLRRNLFEDLEGKTSEIQTPEEILLQIKNKFGVEIPTEISQIYSRKDINNGEVTPNVIPTTKEARVIAETISRIPAAGYLVQLVIPFRSYEEGAVAGGSYTGYQWPVFLHRGDYDEFPYDRLVSGRAAIELQLPSADIDDPLPVKTENSSVLPLLSQIFNQQAGIRINMQDELPWSTHGERLRQALVHEFGHGLEDQVRLAGSASTKEYWDRQAFYIFNKNTADINHPLYVSFAHLTDWRLVPFSEFVRQYSPAYAKKYLESKSDGAEKLVWDRDFNVWGDLANRKMRLTSYASYGPIQEAFAEFWMASILYPQFLTEAERRYFGRIHDGLRKAPGKFVQDVAVGKIDLLRG